MIFTGHRAIDPGPTIDIANWLDATAHFVPAHGADRSADLVCTDGLAWLED